MGDPCDRPAYKLSFPYVDPSNTAAAGVPAGGQCVLEPQGVPAGGQCVLEPQGVPAVGHGGRIRPSYVCAVGRGGPTLLVTPVIQRPIV